MEDLQTYERLGAALLIGLLVGLERSWQSRDEKNGRERNVMGFRTLGLTGLLGGLTGLLAQSFHASILVPVILVLGLLLITGYYLTSSRQGNAGTTTEVASLLVFLLGLLCREGKSEIAVAGAVITVFALGFKRQLHHFIQKINENEMFGTLKLLLITAVVLPVIPDRGFGPWEIWNPYELWWMVVLVAGISYTGYLGTRLAGSRIGIGAAGLLGGLASSTAVTLSFSRLARENRLLENVLAAGIVVSCSTMFPRVLIEVGVLNPGLLNRLILPLGLSTVSAYAGAFWLWIHSRNSVDDPSSGALKNPFELTPAIQFAVLLAAILFFSRAMEHLFGDAGIYAVAAISGITDVDAITLSLSRMSRTGLSGDLAVNGILIAAGVNTMVKAGMVAFIARGRIAYYTILALGLALLAGIPGLFFTVDWQSFRLLLQ